MQKRTIKEIAKYKKQRKCYFFITNLWNKTSITKMNMTYLQTRINIYRKYSLFNKKYKFNYLISNDIFVNLFISELHNVQNSEVYGLRPTVKWKYAYTRDKFTYVKLSHATKPVLQKKRIPCWSISIYHINNIWGQLS